MSPNMKPNMSSIKQRSYQRSLSRISLPLCSALDTFLLVPFLGLSLLFLRRAQ